MKFAIVDIETTGSYAAAGGITEIAIVLHNGVEEEGRFHTLINPHQNIPKYITALTGITNEMVAAAPGFEEVAANIFNLLGDRIFVAHNVNFDYSFIKHHLQEAGYVLNVRKLCTVRLARKVFPGLASYSLGNLCRQMEIVINNRHRAIGDVIATVALFEKIQANDVNGELVKMLRGKNKEQYLPPNLDAGFVNQLPGSPGVYYFHDEKGKILYVGKAVNLRQRVCSHFSNNDSSKRKQEFLRKIFSISFKTCGSELSALILESVEIRRLWPPYNRSQKRFHYEYGLYTYEDQNGYLRLFIERKKKNLPAVYTFNLLHEGQVLLRKLVEEYELHEAFCFASKARVTEKPALNYYHYNKRVQKAVGSLKQQLPTFVLQDEGDNYILMEEGRFMGMGTVKQQEALQSVKALKETITPYPDNDYIRGLVYQYADKFPERKLSIAVQD